MREIKFRAWDKEEKEMLELVTVGCTRKDRWGSLYIKGNIINGFDHRNYDIMQYTGLKDKNGVEIYEGDVVDYFKLSYSTIEWKNGGFIIKRLIDGEYETMQNRIAEIEVIGNVYENPELLEVAK